jgi:hypothetical protein
MLKLDLSFDEFINVKVVQYIFIHFNIRICEFYIKHNRIKKIS